MTGNDQSGSVQYIFNTLFCLLELHANRKMETPYCEQPKPPCAQTKRKSGVYKIAKELQILWTQKRKRTLDDAKYSSCDDYEQGADRDDHKTWYVFHLLAMSAPTHISYVPFKYMNSSFVKMWLSVIKLNWL